MMRIRLVPILEVTGVLLTAYTLIREVFGRGVAPRVIEHGKVDGVEDILAQAQEVILHIGSKIGLIPTEHALSGMDQRLDAEIAIIGFFCLTLAAIIVTVNKFRGH